MRVQIEAPAKLNLHLKVGNRRPDGFHGIESLFLALAFGDTLHAETAHGGPSLEIRMDGQLGGHPAGDPLSFLPPEKNIVARAVSLFRDRTGFDEGLTITVEKRIPLGGGLGGGSSDAAATLLALNRLIGSGAPPLSRADLAEMGASLGSDVPFLLSGVAAAWVAGRGEQVRPLVLPESARGLSVVLVNPGFPSDTAAAFRLLDVFRESHPLDPPSNYEYLMESFAAPPRQWPFTNDFLSVFRDNDGEKQASSGTGTAYQHIIAGLRECGADFAGLSGSGSTCFGVFAGEEKAEKAKKALSKQWPFVINTFFACVIDDTIVQ